MKGKEWVMGMNENGMGEWGERRTKSIRPAMNIAGRTDPGSHRVAATQQSTRRAG